MEKETEREQPNITSATNTGSFSGKNSIIEEEIELVGLLVK